MPKARTALKRFYVVTRTSIYEVEGRIEGRPYPLATKTEMLLIHEESGIRVSETLKGGDLIAICNKLIAYIPEGCGVLSPMSTIQRDIAMVNTRYWGGHSSPIVALFLDGKEAKVCLHSPDLETPDRRWWDQTRAVLEAIGEDHPDFTICKSEGLRLALPVPA